MTTGKIPFNRVTWRRFVREVKLFVSSEVGGKARFLIAALMSLLLAISALNVINSYVGRDFMTAIESRDTKHFMVMALAYIAVFASLTVTAVIFRFSEEHLGLLWRDWMTRRLVDFYLEPPTYYRLGATGEIPNPDQRIAEDVRSFTVTTLSYVLMLLNGSFTAIAFSVVLWSISPTLFLVAVAYASAGTLLTIHLGRPLIGLNYDQLDKEADFRSSLIHVREHTESIALLHRERRLKTQVLEHLEQLVTNFQRIIAVNRNLGFFTTGYSWMIQLIPALIVAPLFIRGEVEFGVITQSATAFATLLGAFSLIVTQFQSISAFAAVVARLDGLWDEIQKAKAMPSPISVCESCEQVQYENLTLRSPRDGRMLLDKLSITVARGTRTLIIAPSDTVRVALFRATAGIWDSGEGRILRPGNDQILFLPERPYSPPCTLRELLVRTGQQQAAADDDIIDTLKLLGLERVPERAGGLDASRNWGNILSLGEQQLLAVARVLLAAPQFVFLDRLGTTLEPERVDATLKRFWARSISYLTLGNSDDDPADYDAILEIATDGSWRWKRIPSLTLASEPGNPPLAGKSKDEENPTTAAMRGRS
ncbi:MAG: ABC transporter ATP-binding protein/permease [Gammaproteobacteria bacterium]